MTGVAVMMATLGLLMAWIHILDRRMRKREQIPFCPWCSGTGRDPAHHVPESPVEEVRR